MLTIEVKVNGKLVKWLGVRNINPHGINERNKYEVHPYEVFVQEDIAQPSVPYIVATDQTVGYITHCRKDGILHLVDNVMTMIGQKMWLMGDEEAKKLGDPV